MNAMLDLKSTQPWVFIVGDGSLFDSGVTQLVTHGTDLQVSHTVCSYPPAFLDLPQWDAWPETILVNESGLLEADHILGLVSAQIVSSEPVIVGTRIIIVRIHINRIDVYTHPLFVAGKILSKPHQINIRTSADLLNIVTNARIDQ
jgi:hypothetical protein